MLDPSKRTKPIWFLFSARHIFPMAFDLKAVLKPTATKLGYAVVVFFTFLFFVIGGELHLSLSPAMLLMLAIASYIIGCCFPHIYRSVYHYDDQPTEVRMKIIQEHRSALSLSPNKEKLALSAVLMVIILGANVLNFQMQGKPTTVFQPLNLIILAIISYIGAVLILGQIRYVQLTRSPPAKKE